MIGEMWSNVRAQQPLVHCISNIVTANDCANLLLAAGASPIMAEAPEEAAEIAAMCAGVTLNLGTPNPRKIEAMVRAGRAANGLGRPAVLDPVGAGCSDLRRQGAKRLLEEVRFAAIRGNAAEIAALAQGGCNETGVDASAEIEPPLESAVRLARRTGAVVIVTAGSDLITDGETVIRVYNGHPMMRLVTGAGCMLSALLGALLAANPGQPLHAALAAVCAMGLAGEIAHRRLGPEDGNAAYRGYIIDAICNLTPERLKEGAKYEIQ